MAQHRSTGAKDLVITCIKGDGRFLKFWALPLNALETVKNFESHFIKLSGELNSSYGFARSEHIPIGSKCVVKSKIKNMWCRARVLAQQSNSEVLVQLMDYGNEESIFVQDVRNVDDQILSVPSQAVECIMADVVPARGTEWCAEAINFCEQQLLYNTLSCYVVSEYMKLPVVRVAKKGESEPFVQRLINIGLALIKQETPAPPTPQPSLTYKMNNLDLNSVHLVRVSFIESAHKFFVQLSAAEVELKNLMDAINRLPAETLSSIKLPIVNTPCLAQLSSKPCFYRGLITLVHHTTCKVFFVDYGFTESKEIQELRAIPPNFVQLSAQAICCSLPSNINIDPNEFKQHINYEHLECHIMSRQSESYIVKLHRRGQDILATPPAYVQQKLNPGAKCEVTVSYINDLQEFYCQLTHFKEQQNAISTILNSNYNFAPMSFPECVPGKPVCVKFSEDNLWYRAQIVKVSHESDIEVFFVDFGNVDNVNLRDVKKMTPEVFKFPMQAYKCHLHETPLPTDSKAIDDAFELFEELTTDQCLFAQVNAVNGDSGYAITLYSKASKLSINEQIQSVSISVPVIPVSDLEMVFVTTFVSADSFFVQFEKIDSDKLTQMQDDINNFYSGRSNASYVPHEGSLVCARFEEDELFYRAKVEKMMDGFCEVFFIDYGNRESIPVKDVFPLDASFTKFPQFGTDCALENVPPQVSSDKLSSVLLENSFQFKMIRKENDKWYVSPDRNFSGNASLVELLSAETAAPRSIHGTGLSGYQEKSKVQTYSNEYRNSEVNQYNHRSENKVYGHTENPVKKEFKKSEPVKEEFEDYLSISIPPKACRHVYVSHVISPSEFYCQIEEDSSKLQLLMKTVEDVYSVEDKTLNFTKLVNNAPCCAIFEDGIWYRGQIKNIGANSCDIFFVDYGNTDAVSTSEIKKLKNDLFRWPAQALRCKSFNISPKGGDWTEDEINAFINMTLDKSFIAQFVECDTSGSYAVNLVSIGKIENDIFNKEFVNLGFGRLQDPGKSLVLNSHAASANLSFSRPTVTIGSSEPVEVTYGLNPGEIFCQLKSSANDFKKMMLNLQEYYNKVSEAESLVDRPHQGMICVAQFFLDSAWYRAEIKKVEANKIAVLYVDYGNSETVERKKIRCIVQDYTSLPVQAVKCRIRGISPPGKTWTVNQNISKYFEGNSVCKFISKEEDSYIVDMTCNAKNVAQLLVDDGLAKSDSSVTQTEIKPISRVKEISQATQQTLPPRKDSFVSGQLLSVIVSYIDNPSKFWCQLLDESGILDDLMADIDDKVSELLPVDSSQLTVNSYCIAQYSEDDAWYRAQIRSLEPENTFKVFFIDYGNSEVVSQSQIKALPSEFTKFPPQCITCCLQNTPSKVLPEMTTLFRDTVEGLEELTAKVESFRSDICTITLLFEKEDVELNVSELLFGVSEEACVTSSAESPKFLPPDVPLGLHDGYISTVNSPQDFYIQLAGIEDDLADLSTELADASESSPTVNLQDLCVGYACSTKFSEDDSWYRAEVTVVLDSTVDVLYVDYGNVDTVPKDSLKMLSEKHLQIPIMAIKGKLNGIVPASDTWSDEAINTFQDMVLDSCLGITFISKDIPAAVNIAKEDKEITQTLVDMELANFESCAETDEAYAEDHLAPPPSEDPLSSLPNDQSYPERKLSSSKLNVKICYVDSHDKFYITPLDLKTELVTVMQTLKLLYVDKDNSESAVTKSTTPETLSDPKVSMPCVAKYSEDGLWYRAVITEIDGENIFVSFVDYGNSEITTLDDLRTIGSELVKIPPIALECSLYGIESIEGKESEIIAKLEDYFVEGIELEMEICEISPFKVKLNNNGDVASVFIQEGLAKEVDVAPPECEAFIDNSKMTFVDESLEYRIQISKRFFTGVDKIIGNVKFCEIENDVVAFHVVSADLEDELQALQEKLQDAYSEPPANLPNVACMDFCATKYMEDENWYRAQVLSSDKDKFKVRFIDYGNCETVDRSDIYELLPDFIMEPQFSVKCILFGMKINKSKEVELQNRLDECVYHEAVELKLCKYSHVVCDLCVSSILCGDVDVSETILNEELVSQQYITRTSLDVRFKATVQKVESDAMYLFPIDLMEERDAFQIKLQELCNGLEISTSDIVIKCLYAAKIDGLWYRVSIISTADSDSTVYLADFGSTKVVDNSDLVLLPTDICHQPLFLLPCIAVANEQIQPQNLSVGTVISCELKKTYPMLSPYTIQILEIDPDKSSSTITSIREQLNDATYTAANVVESSAGEKKEDSDIEKSDNLPHSEIDVPISVDEIKRDEQTVTEGIKDPELQNVEENNFQESEIDVSDENQRNSNEAVDKSDDLPQSEIDEPILVDEIKGDEQTVPECLKDPELQNIEENNFQEAEIDVSDENQRNSNEAVDKSDDLPQSEIDEAILVDDIKRDEQTVTEGIKDPEQQNIEENNFQESEIDVSGENQRNSNYALDENELSSDEKENIDVSFENQNDDAGVKDQLAEEGDKLSEQNDDVCHENQNNFEEVEANSSKVMEELSEQPTVENELDDAKFEYASGDANKSESEVEDCGNDAKLSESGEGQKDTVFDGLKDLAVDEVQTHTFEDLKQSQHDINNEICGNESDTVEFNEEALDKNNELNLIEKHEENKIEAHNEDEELFVSNVEYKETGEIQEENSETEFLEPELTYEDREKLIESIEKGAEQSELNKSAHDTDTREDEEIFQSDVSLDELIETKMLAEGNACDIKDENDDEQNSEGNFEFPNSNEERTGTSDVIIDDPNEFDMEIDSIEENSTENFVHTDDTVVETCNQETGDKTSLEELKSLNYSNKINDEQHELNQHELLNSSEDACRENNRGIEDSYQLSGSVQVKLSDIAISDGSVIFAVQPLYLREEFSLLKQTMQDYYTSNGSSYDETSNFCVVFHEDEWCRSKSLLKSEDGGGWTVMLVDYGKCVSEIPSSDVKNLDNEHSNFPPFAVWCTLSSVYCSAEKTEMLKTFLYDSLKDTDVVIKILEGGEPYKINVFVGESSVLNQLLKNSLVTQKLPDVYLESGSYKSKLSFLNVNSKTVEIFVKLSCFSEEFNILKDSMQNSYKLEDSVTNLVESGIYAICYNEVWYRGKVMSSGNDIRVFLVDTGETVYSCKNLCFLLPEHCLQPAHAIPCCIPFDVNATNEISESINNVLKTTEFLVNIEICPDTKTVSATLIDEQVVKEVKNMGLTCASETDSKTEINNSELNDSKLPSESSSESLQNEASEHLVGYLEETFTTES